MKTLIFILIVISFLQSTILPFNLCLIILICRSHIRSDKYNLYLAFGFGLLISHLTLTPLGVYSLVFLILTQSANLLSKTRFTVSSLFVIPVVFLSLLLNNLITSLIINQPIIIGLQIFIESGLSLPVFYLVRLWEERYIVRKEIKLRV